MTEHPTARAAAVARLIRGPEANNRSLKQRGRLSLAASDSCWDRQPVFAYLIFHNKTPLSVPLLRTPVLVGHIRPNLLVFTPFPPANREPAWRRLPVWPGRPTGSRLPGRQHIRSPERVSEQLRALHPGRWLAFRQHKNRNRSPVDLVIPILPRLETVMAASPCGRLTFLETEFHRP
jgi:hypothetical protein